MRTSITPLTTPSTRLVRVGVALTALASALLLVLAATASAAEKGVVTDLTWGIPSSDVGPTQAAISDLGARWVRLEFRWYEGEPQRGSYSNTTLKKWDQAVATAQAAGAKVVAMVHRAPTWASGASDTMSPPADPADYANFMRFLVSRYRGKVAAWEIWNEENGNASGRAVKIQFSTRSCSSPPMGRSRQSTQARWWSTGVWPTATTRSWSGPMPLGRRDSST